MSRGWVDKSGILTFRPRVVSVTRRKVAERHQQEEYKEKDVLVSNFEAISGPEDETSRLIGNKQEVVRKCKRIGVKVSSKVVIVDGNKVVTEDKLTNRKLLDHKKKEKELFSKTETGVHNEFKMKVYSSELSKEDADLISSRDGPRIELKLWQMTGIRIARYGQGGTRSFIRGSEEAVMEAKSIIHKEEAFLQDKQIMFLCKDGGKRMRRLQKDSKTVMVIRGKFGDDMRPVTFIGTKLAKTSAKVMLEEAVIIQTKNLLDSEVDILLDGGGKLIKRIQNEAEVCVEFKGKRGDKGRATNVIGSKEAIAKAWALIQKALSESRV